MQIPCFWCRIRLVKREEIVQVLEHACTLISSLDDLDDTFKEEARIRLRRIVEIICIQDMMPETAVEEENDLNDPPTEEDDQIQEQLNLVLEKVEELENEMGFCRDDVLWDSMYMDHGIKRKRMRARNVDFERPDKIGQTRILQTRAPELSRKNRL